MSENSVSRRQFLSLFGFGGTSFGLASIFSILQVEAAIRLPSWLFAPHDLSKEVESLRDLLSQSNHPDFRAGSMVGGYPAGPRIGWYFEERTTRLNALFGVPSKCADDVLRKYAMPEEICWRGFCRYMSKISSQENGYIKQFDHWYAQLDEDRQKFGVDINPWWQEGAPSVAMINGQCVRWDEREWHIVL